MSNVLYMEDSYLKEFEATVKSVKDDKFVVLDQTAFYPKSGGQPNDTGKLTTEDGTEYNVVFAGKFSGEISHEVDKPGLKEGDKVKGTIDWDRRYRLMRMHTATHVLSSVFIKEAGALITGNQLDLEKTRIDFSLEDFDRDKISDYVKKANELSATNAEIKVSFMPREEVEQKPELARLAKGLPEGVKTLRIVNIEGIDIQADGGTHVKNTSEVGTIEVLDCKNKGKNNRRIYLTIKP
jgi:misacylated tRNA(Ala) deacylase